MDFTSPLPYESLRYDTHSIPICSFEPDAVE